MRFTDRQVSSPERLVMMSYAQRVLAVKSLRSLLGAEVKISCKYKT